MGGRGKYRLAAACLSICLAIGIAGIASAAVPVRIVSPAGDQLISSKTFRVVLQTGKRTAAPRVEISGKNVSSRFKRDGSTRWTATLNRSSMAAGANELAVSAKAGEDRGFAVVKVVKGKRDQRFLNVRAPRRSVTPVSVRFGTRQKADLFVRARLNQRDASDAFGPEFGSTRRAKLSPSYGLRYGKNVLRIRAARSGGAFDVKSRTINVPRTKPLAAAGRDRLVRGGGRIRLNGAATKATRRGAKLGYRWKLIGKPKGSKAKLTGARKVKPAFRADRIGTYRARLVVTEKKRTRKGTKRVKAVKSSDVVEISNGIVVPPLGLPIDTLSDPENQGPGIAYNGQFTPIQYQYVGMEAMIIDRQTGEILFQQTVAGTASDAAALNAQISATSSSAPLVVMSASNFTLNPDPAYNQIIKSLTGSALSNDAFTQAPFSVIAIPGAPDAAWTNGGWTNLDVAGMSYLPGKLKGYLQLDSSGNLAFVPSMRYAVDSSAAGAPAGQNTISIAGQDYPSGPLASGCGTGGFQIQTVNAEHPGQAIHSRTFTTNGCGATADPAGQQAMTDFLQNDNTYAESIGSQIFVIQSIGNPRGANDSNWSELADAIGATGGNKWDFNAMDPAGDSFAMLSGSYFPGTSLPGFPVTQSTQHDTGKPAHLTAVLKQGRDGFMVGRQASGTNPSFEFGLHMLAYQPDDGAPFPNASSTEELAALKYIANTVLELPAPQDGISCYVPAQPDVRSEYCNPNVKDSWGSTDEDGYTQKLQSAAYPGSGSGFSETIWNALRCDFIGANCTGSGNNDEWGSIPQVWSDIETLKDFVLESNSGALADANLAAQNVRDSITKNMVSTTGIWVDVFANIASGISFLPIEEGQLVAGEISTAGLLAEDWVNGMSGNPELGRFNDKSATFLADLSSTFTDSFEALDQTRNLILTDANKLYGLAKGDYISGDMSKGLPAFAFGVSRFAYKTLLPAAYSPVRLERTGINSGVTDASAYQCGAAGQYNEYAPFPGAPASAQWFPTGGSLYVMVLDGSPLPDNDARVTPPMPTDTLMKPLFEPYATDSTNVIPTQFGFKPDTFYPNLWDIPSVRSVSC